MRTQVIHHNPLQTWLMAIRPKTLTASIVPVMLGSVLAWHSMGEINFTLVLSGLLTALCVQIGTNLVNDALDCKKGADTARRIGPPRVTHQGLLTPMQVLSAGFGFLLLAFVFGGPLMNEGGLPIIAAILASIVCAYCYSGGPYPISYIGLTDLFVIGFFGIVCTTALYYAQTGALSLPAIVVGIEVGMLASAMSVINNLRDIVEDSQSGKRTLAVRFGPLFSRVELAIMIFGPYALNLYAFYQTHMSAALAPFLVLPLGIAVVQAVATTEPSSLYNRFLAMAALHQLLFGILLIAGILL